MWVSVSTVIFTIIIMPRYVVASLSSRRHVRTRRLASPLWMTTFGRVYHRSCRTWTLGCTPPPPGCPPTSWGGGKGQKVQRMFADQLVTLNTQPTVIHKKKHFFEIIYFSFFMHNLVSANGGLNLNLSKFKSFRH